MSQLEGDYGPIGGGASGVTVGTTTSTGAANTVLKTNATGQVANSVITDDGTNVGIAPVGGITTIGNGSADTRQWLIRDLNNNNFAALYNKATSGGVADATYAFAAAAADTRVNSPTGGNVTLNIANVPKLTVTATEITLPSGVTLVIPLRTITTATDAGTAGSICADANFIYFCVATNVWKRVAIATW